MEGQIFSFSRAAASEFRVVLAALAREALNVSLLEECTLIPFFVSITIAQVFFFFLSDQAKVSFIQNSAKIKGAAVYISTLSACLWYEKHPFYSLHRAIRWNNTFEYRDNFIHPAKNFKPLKGPEYDIATDTHHFQSEGSSEIKVDCFFNFSQ